MKFDKLMEKKKKDKPMSDVAKDAKTSVLKDLQSMASNAMKDGLKGGLKKVTVASDSPEGLKAGLEKAEDMVEGKLGAIDEKDADTDLEDAAEELPIHAGGAEEGEDEMEDCSEEELDAKLEKLMAMKKKMQANKA
jgi:hypothetical protein